MEKMKSVCFQVKSQDEIVFLSSTPFPKVPPEPIAICDCIIWYPEPSGSFSGLKSVKILCF